MLLRRITKHVKDQNWFAVSLDFFIVVIGVFIGIQVANWNERINDREEQYAILESLERDIKGDIVNVKGSIESLEIITKNYLYCLKVLSNEIDASKAEFDKRFATVLTNPYFSLKRSSFESIISSGKLELIENTELSISISSFYNNSYDDWNTAMRDYTRNIIAPYLLNFDYIPDTEDMTKELLQAFNKNYGAYINDFTSFDNSKFNIKPKTLDDYRNNIFIINILRQKLWNHEGQIEQYKKLADQMQNLILDIALEQELLR